MSVFCFFSNGNFHSAVSKKFNVYFHVLQSEISVFVKSGGFEESDITASVPRQKGRSDGEVKLLWTGAAEICILAT